MALTYLQNLPYSNAPAILLRIKTELVLHGWSVVDSGDGRVSIGVLGIYGAGTDVISTSHTTSTYVANSISNFYAWVRLRAGGGIGAPEVILYHAANNPGADAFGILLIPKTTLAAAPYASAAADSWGTIPATEVAVPWGSSIVATPGLAGQQTDVFDGDSTTARHVDMAFGDASDGYCWYAFSRTAARRYYRGLFLDYIAPANLNPVDTGAHVAGFARGVTPWAVQLGVGNGNWGPYNDQNAGGENAGTPGFFSSTEGDPYTTEEILNRRGRTPLVIIPPTVGTLAQNHGTDLGLNPYNSQPDILVGSCWYYRPNRHEDFSTRGNPRFPGIKGKSTLFHFGLGGATDMARATGANLVAQGSGKLWIRYDSTVAPTDPGGGAITAAVTPNLHTFADLTWAGMHASFEPDMLSESVGDVGDMDPIRWSPQKRGSFQRVWDNVNSVWCYYTAPYSNPSPASYETTPPHSGSISLHSIIQVL